MSFQTKLRLVNDAPVELEWTYLVNETLAGERCILPLLEDLAADMRLPTGLRRVLTRQIGEEVDHVRRYEQVFNGKGFYGTGFEVEFCEFVTGLDSNTLKIFSLQAILESISLAALTYRFAAFDDCPSSTDDRQILRDEEGHVRFGLAFLGHLQELEGTIDARVFHSVAQRANAIFAKHLCGEQIAHFMHRNFGLKTISSAAIDHGEGMRVFRKICNRTVVRVKNEFVGRYVKSTEQRP